jgi:hypothetical protein
MMGSGRDGFLGKFMDQVKKFVRISQHNRKKENANFNAGKAINDEALRPDIIRDGPGDKEDGGRGSGGKDKNRFGGNDEGGNADGGNADGGNASVGGDGEDEGSKKGMSAAAMKAMMRERKADDEEQDEVESGSEEDTDSESEDEKDKEEKDDEEKENEEKKDKEKSADGERDGENNSSMLLDDNLFGDLDEFGMQKPSSKGGKLSSQQQTLAMGKGESDRDNIVEKLINDAGADDQVRQNLLQPLITRPGAFYGDGNTWACRIDISGEACPAKLLLTEIIKSLMRDMYAQDPKAKNIIKVNVLEEAGDIVKIETEGVNLDALYNLPMDLQCDHEESALDYPSMYTNCIGTILDTYGVEAAKKSIVKEIGGVFGHYGIAVDQRHLSIISDYMAVLGGYRAFSRRGLHYAASPWLQMTYETSTAFAMGACSEKMTDNLNGMAAAIIVGNAPACGTGAFDVMHDFSKKTERDLRAVERELKEKNDFFNSDSEDDMIFGRVGLGNGGGIGFGNNNGGRQMNNNVPLSEMETDIGSPMSDSDDSSSGSGSGSVRGEESLFKRRAKGEEC